MKRKKKKKENSCFCCFFWLIFLIEKKNNWYSGPASSLNSCCTSPCYIPPFRRESPTYFQLTINWEQNLLPLAASISLLCCPVPSIGDPHDCFAMTEQLRTPWSQRCSPTEPTRYPFSRRVLSSWLLRASSCRVCCLHFYQWSRSLFIIANHLFGTSCWSCCSDSHLMHKGNQPPLTLVPDAPLGLCMTVGSFENSAAA